jgi:1-acyl-sn-glycerol-3-phosphate acyltransferase
MAFGAIAHLEVSGRENMPDAGPMLVIANHFHFADPACLIHVVRAPLEFLGGFNMPNAPAIVHIFPGMYGVYAVRRGEVSRNAMRAAKSVLAQGGLIGIFPEAGSWAQVLRPARPGAPFIAAETGAPVLPVGIDGMNEIFPSLRQGKRARVTVRIGSPIGPFQAPGRGRARRARLGEIGDQMMRAIAELIPAEKHGVFSADPAIRAAAQGAAAYPWENATESQITRM